MLTPPSLSIITPTCGRPSLFCTIMQTAEQMGLYDEHLVVVDGDLPYVSAVLERLTIVESRLRVFQTPLTNRFGNAQRDLAISNAKGDFLVFLDDDDLLMPDALEKIRTSIHSKLPHMFQLKEGDQTLGKAKRPITLSPDLRGSMMVVPTDTPNMPKWDTEVLASNRTHSQQEFSFMQGVAELYGNNVVWVPEVTHYVPAASNGKRPNV